MIAQAYSFVTSNTLTRPAWFKDGLSAWTNKVLKAIAKNVNEAELSAELRAHAKIMSLMSASLRLDEGVQAVSAKFSDGILSESDSRIVSPNTAQSVRAFSTGEFGEIAKDSIVAQLLSHELAPTSYEMSDGAFVIDFTRSRSRLTCVFDDYGLQIMWRTPNGSESEVIRKDALHAPQIIQKIVMILHIGESSH